MYTVNLRMKNPGPAKFLIESKETTNYMEAFLLAVALVEKHGLEENFVEILDERNDEVFAYGKVA